MRMSMPPTLTPRCVPLPCESTLGGLASSVEDESRSWPGGVAQGECVRSEERFEGLDALIARRGGALLATATLLAGGPAAGEDLLQAALERVMRHWHRVKDEPEIYLRRTIYHLAVDQWRARRRRPEVLGKTETELEAAGLRAM